MKISRDKLIVNMMGDFELDLMCCMCDREDNEVKYGYPKIVLVLHFIWNRGRPIDTMLVPFLSVVNECVCLL